MAVEAIEGWILALLGDLRSESHAKPKDQLAEVRHIWTTKQKVEAVQNADFEHIAPDARSLKQWITRAEVLQIGAQGG
jgi:hypothetical protein